MNDLPSNFHEYGEGKRSIEFKENEQNEVLNNYQRVALILSTRKKRRTMHDLQDQIKLQQKQIVMWEAISWFENTQQENEKKIAEFDSDRKFHQLKSYTEKELRLKDKIGSDGAMNFSRLLGEIRLFSYSGSELPKILHDNVISHVGITNIQGQQLLITESLYFSAEIYKEVTLKTYKDVVGQLDLEKMLKFCLDIARALRYLHLKKIAYRNLTLERILVNENQAKLEHPAIVAPNEIHKSATYQDIWRDIQQFCSIFSEELSWNFSRQSPKRTKEEFSYEMFLDFLEEFAQKEYFAQTSNINLDGIITLLEELIPRERCGISYDLSVYLKTIESSQNELKNKDLLPISSLHPLMSGDQNVLNVTQPNSLDTGANDQGKSLGLDFRPSATQLCSYLTKSDNESKEASQQEPVGSDSTGNSTLAVVSQNGFMFDPDRPIIDETLPHYTSPDFGECVQLQRVDYNLQGYYLFAKNGKFGGYTGPVLIKYFNLRGNELSRQAREFYTVNGVPEHAIANTHAAEVEKNRKRELHFVRKMIHPNIVKIVAYISPGGRSENINGIVMEGASEGPLDIYSTRVELSSRQRLLFSYQLASALAYCHREGVIHRDIRPRNIYVFDNGTNVKLGNFGFAREVTDGPMAANKGEEIYYKAPEIIYGGPVTNYGFSVDVYSYGMVVWTICHNGAKPFQDISPNILKSANRFRTFLEQNVNGNPNANRPPITLNPQDPESESLINIIKACWINEVKLDDKRPSMDNIVSYLTEVSSSC